MPHLEDVVYLQQPAHPDERGRHDWHHETGRGIELGACAGRDGVAPVLQHGVVHLLRHAQHAAVDEELHVLQKKNDNFSQR